MNIVQERLHTLSQTSKGLRNGVCDNVCSRSSASPTAILVAIRAEKVLPMCVPEVLPTSPLCAERRPYSRKVVHGERRPFGRLLISFNNSAMGLTSKSLFRIFRCCEPVQVCIGRPIASGSQRQSGNH